MSIKSDFEIRHDRKRELRRERKLERKKRMSGVIEWDSIQCTECEVSGTDSYIKYDPYDFIEINRKILLLL